jgi:predicted glycosyltransferase
MAGYNTLTEILRFRKRAVIVPRPGPSAEQRMRAAILAARGFVSTIDPANLSPATLASAIVSTLSGPQPAQSATFPGLCGVAQATRALLDMLSQNGAGKSAHGARPRGIAQSAASLPARSAS